MILAGVAAEYTPSLDTAVDARHSGNRIPWFMAFFKFGKTGESVPNPRFPIRPVRSNREEPPFPDSESAESGAGNPRLSDRPGRSPIRPET